MPQRAKLITIVAISLLVAIGGVSYGMTGHPVPFTGSSDQITLQSHSESPKPEKTPKPDRTPKPDKTAKPAKTPHADHGKHKGEGNGSERSTEGCPDGFTGNHGQFVSHSHDKQAAAESECGKPVNSIDGPKSSESPEPSESPEAEHDNGDHGNSGDHGGNDD